MCLNMHCGECKYFGELINNDFHNCNNEKSIYKVCLESATACEKGEKMSSVYKDITVTLTDDEKKVLQAAIELCAGIARDCNNEDMFVDASTIFACVYGCYKNNELPTNIPIYE